MVLSYALMKILGDWTMNDFKQSIYLKVLVFSTSVDDFILSQNSK